MKLLKEKLERKLETVASACMAVMGLGFMDPADGDEFYVNGDEVFAIGSSIKIPVLMEFFRKAEAGLIDPGEHLTLREEHMVGGSGVLQFLTPGEASLPLIDYATLMINLSDNVATNILIDLVGMDDVNSLLRELGHEVTMLQRRMIDWEAARAGKENISTPREAVKLLTALINRDGLSDYVCESTLNIMKKPKRGVFRETVPQSIEIANKPGGVDGAQCDWGLVMLPNKPYAVTIMTKHVPKTDTVHLETQLDMTLVSRLIYEYFEEKSLTTKYGRRT